MTINAPTLAREIAAALDWWRACGVDCDFADDARAWLLDAAVVATEPPALKPSSKTALTGVVGEDAENASPGVGRSLAPVRRDFWGESPPANLPAFQEWWMHDPALAQRGLFARVAPRGIAKPLLMVVVPDPEEGDTETLLSGAQGRLLAAMLAAMGVAQDQCYIASALPAHTPMADLPALAASGLDRVLALHITLVEPKKVVLFGQGLANFLDTSQISGHRDDDLREINHGPVSSQVMVTESLAAMLGMPQLKARFWRRWMDWSAL